MATPYPNETPDEGKFSVADLNTAPCLSLIRQGILIVHEADIDGPCIYVMGPKSGAALRKCGITIELRKRRSQLEAACGRRLLVFFVHPFETVDQARMVETRTHALLARNRQKGEWFRATPRMIREAIVDAVIGCGLVGKVRSPQRPRLIKKKRAPTPIAASQNRQL